MVELEELLRQCVECKAVKEFSSREWLTKESPDYRLILKQYGRNITSGYCPDCYRKEMERLNARKPGGYNL